MDDLRRIICAVICLATFGAALWGCSRKDPFHYWPVIAAGLFMTLIFGMGAGVR